MRDRRHSQRDTDSAGDIMQLENTRLEDVIDSELAEDDMVDDEYLREVFAEPRKYLPPPRSRSAREPEGPPREPESPLARRSKLVGLVLAAALLSGSIVGAALIADQRSEGSVQAADPDEIVGAAALGVFAAPDGPDAPPPVPPAAPDPAPPTTTVPVSADTPQVPQPADPGPGAPAEGNGPAAPVPSGQSGRADLDRPSSGDHLSLVREFYRLVSANPQEALALLAPDLRADQPGELVRAWSSMASVTLSEARLRGDGSVLAVVMMVQPDGEKLRVTQLLSFDDGPQHLISQARLLSAQNV
ncbi:hypothetical protein CFN78_01760 [Amycolatopsis antarctica]|uniref:Uncharacterized protein n=1 Tax=Amycolatopsis antarctica TaxID=1854586 RepID=A0A263D8W9_9PSEU|nr:hypothetical protein [Amycolatopsis antarctica]OZM74952.1 hypothetical protein CFN78_01760 [Amycolatopsis antarctica]